MVWSDDDDDDDHALAVGIMWAHSPGLMTVGGMGSNS